LAIQLANGVDNNFHAKGEKGYIIVETNQRVYAYTSNILLIFALIS
jgi:hypothetical protein